MAREAVVSPQPALLGLLMLGPRHPYDLHQEFDRELGRVWYVGRSHLYTYLKRLAESGLVMSKTESQLNRPARTIYHLTPTGRNAFLAWLHRPTQHVRNVRLEFLARVYFFRRLELPGLGQVILEQQTLLKSRIASLEHAIAGSENEYWRLVLEFRRCEMQAIVGWLDYCLKTT